MLITHTLVYYKKAGTFTLHIINCINTSTMTIFICLRKYSTLRPSANGNMCTSNSFTYKIEVTSFNQVTTYACMVPATKKGICTEVYH